MSRTTGEKPDHSDAKHEDTTSKQRTGDKANAENTQDEMSERLDEGLEETFPSSDPVSVKVTK